MSVSVAKSHRVSESWESVVTVTSLKDPEKEMKM